MKRLLLILTLITTMIIANGAQARIGWTLEQCNNKYGTPFEDGAYPNSSAHDYSYKVGEFKIEITIYNGTVIGIAYSGKISPEAVQVLLEKNAPTGGWNATPFINGDTHTFYPTDRSTGYMAVGYFYHGSSFETLVINKPSSFAAMTAETARNKNLQEQGQKNKDIQNTKDNL